MMKQIRLVKIRNLLVWLMMLLCEWVELRKFIRLMVQISEVFWNRMMFCCSSSGVILWNVCGRIIRCMVCLQVMFSVWVVFIWFFGMVWMLVWMILQQQVVLNIMKVIRQEVNVFIGVFLLVIQCRMKGIVKQNQVIISSSGIEWKQLMQKLVMFDSNLLCDSCISVSMVFSVMLLRMLRIISLRVISMFFQRFGRVGMILLKFIIYFLWRLGLVW